TRKARAGDYYEFRSRREQVAAQLAELELAERLGRVGDGAQAAAEFPAGVAPGGGRGLGGPGAAGPAPRGDPPQAAGWGKFSQNGARMFGRNRAKLQRRGRKPEKAGSRQIQRATSCTGDQTMTIAEKLPLGPCAKCLRLLAEGSDALDSTILRMPDGRGH